MSVFSDPAYLMRLLALADPSQLQALASQAGDPQIQQAVAQEMQRRQAGPNALRPEDMVQPPPGTPWQGGGQPAMNLPPTGAPPAGLPPGMTPPGSPPMGGMAEHQSFGESVGNEIAGLHKPAAPGPPGITPRAVKLTSGKAAGPSESDVLNMAELARIKARRGMLGGGGGGMFGGMGAA